MKSPYLKTNILIFRAASQCPLASVIVFAFLIPIFTAISSYINIIIFLKKLIFFKENKIKSEFIDPQISHKIEINGLLGVSKQ